MRVVVALAAVVALSVSVAVLADAETDAKVGRCVIHAIALGNEAAAEAALDMADNRERAMRFAGSYADQVARLRQRDAWNATMERGWAVEGARACSQVGVRVSDY